MMKKTALFLACFFLLLCLLPISAAGQGEMEKLILLVKERVEIPEICTEFQGRMNVWNGKEQWDFNWSVPEDSPTYGYTSVTVDPDGFIENVYIYTATEEGRRSGKILPVLSEEEAKAAALRYAAGINPSVAEWYSTVKEVSLAYDVYMVTLIRTWDETEVLNNTAFLQIDSRTGKLRSYGISHTKNDQFADLTGVISKEQAKSAYRENGYLKRVYRIFDGEDTAKLVYSVGRSGSLLDARSGKEFDPADSSEEMRNGQAAIKAEATDSAGGGLTPQERQAVEEIAGLIPYTDAAEKIQSMEELYVPENMEFSYGTTYKMRDGRYVIQISLSGDGKEYYGYASAELDGQSGELLSYYAYTDKQETAEPDAEKAKKIYRAFAEKYLTAYADELAEPEATAQRDSTFLDAPRTVRGIRVEDNGVSMTIHAATGKIMHYNLSWNRNVTFPTPNGTMDDAAAYERFYEETAPTLYYFAQETENVPVYALADSAFAYIDAASGMLLGWDGHAYEKTEVQTYTDIDGHFAKDAILALASIGARLGTDGLFLPDQTITQAEFVGLVTSCVMDYYPLSGGRLDTEKLLTFACDRGIMKAEEQAAEEPLTRELAVTYLLRGMGYKEFAEIPGIFACDFQDAAEIDSACFGYTAIAKGLGIVHGNGAGYFFPKQNMTRAEAAVVLYNYLKK